MVEAVDVQDKQEAAVASIVAPQQAEDPLDIAKRRQAYGEITPKEFEKIYGVLHNSG